MMMRTLLTTLLLLLAATTTAVAETRYVDDKLVINLRTGKANTYRILETLPSGTPLEVLEQDGYYSRVRTSDGIEGWVQSQFLSKTPIAKVRLARTERQLEKLRKAHDELQQQLAALQNEKGELSTERENLSGETQRLREELAELKDVSARPIELAENNRKLKDTINTLQQENQQLVSDNERLKDRSQREWFIVGAGVLLGGIFLGLVLPMLRRKKKSGMFD